MSRRVLVGLSALVATVAGCASRFPVGLAKLLTIGEAEVGLQHGEDRFQETLQIRWLGATCHLMQLGDVAVLTDPFLSRQGLLRVGLGTIASDPDLVRSEIARLPVARAIFVGHSHYDHLLDAWETLAQPGWEQVPLYGSSTTANILAGYNQGEVPSHWSATQTEQDWRPAGNGRGLAYKACVAQHGPQLPGVLLYPGKVEQPRTAPPTRACHFKVGDTYTYVFRLSNSDVEFSIYFVGAATSAPMGFPDESVQEVDVAVLCVPGWKNVTGYPEEFIRRLRPKHIVLSHYDNFFQPSREQRELVATADLPRFLERVQAAACYPGFERILVPDIGAVVTFQKP